MAKSQLATMTDDKIREQMRYLEAHRSEEEGIRAN